MVQANRDQLQSTIKTLQQRFGPQVLKPASALQSHSAVISTGFAHLDRILRIGGVPLNAITLLGGRITSGKRALVYKILREAQRSSPERLQSVSIVDLARAGNYDFAARCGIHLDHL